MVDYLKLAIVSMILNVLLSHIVPLILPKTNNKYLNEFRHMFVHHKETLITSSVIVAIAVVLSVLIINVLPL
tara:strand:+ start:328 stop:543 length:216 start_codon:yes stop_codon:yes gene_type:complete